MAAAQWASDCCRIATDLVGLFFFLPLIEVAQTSFTMRVVVSRHLSRFGLWQGRVLYQFQF